MRVVVPYAGRVHPKADDALARYAPEAEFVDVSESDTAYHSLLCRLWKEGEAFALIEHDVEIGPHTVADLRACHPWCVFPFARALPGPHATWLADEGRWSEGIALLERSLGCTRFGSWMIQHEPDLMTAALAAPIPWEDGVKGHFRRLDNALGHVLAERHYDPHIHHPEVVHHHWLSRWNCCTCGDPSCAQP